MPELTFCPKMTTKVKVLQIVGQYPLPQFFRLEKLVRKLKVKFLGGLIM